MHSKSTLKTARKGKIIHNVLTSYKIHAVLFENEPTLTTCSKSLKLLVNICYKAHNTCTSLDVLIYVWPRLTFQTFPISFLRLQNVKSTTFQGSFESINENIRLQKYARELFKRKQITLQWSQEDWTDRDIKAL